MAKRVLQRIAERIRQKGTEGAFSKQAHSAGMSTGAFASKVSANPDEFSTKTKRRANLSKIFAKYRPH